MATPAGWEGICVGCGKVIAKGAMLDMHPLLGSWVHVTPCLTTTIYMPAFIAVYAAVKHAKLEPLRHAARVLQVSCDVNGINRTPKEALKFYIADQCSDVAAVKAAIASYGKKSEPKTVSQELERSEQELEHAAQEKAARAWEAKQKTTTPAPKSEENTMQPAQGNSLLDAITAVINAGVDQKLEGLDERIRTLAATVTSSHGPRELLIKVGELPKVNIGIVHKQFDQLLKLVGTCQLQVWISGPAGGGKTHAAAQVAKALGLRFFFNGAIESEYKLSGFVDAGGRIISTAFREAYTHGGLYLFDECDGSLAGALMAFNAALENGHCDFPGASEPTPRHPNFRVIAAGNTWGLGGSADYVGTAKLNAAFLDRFVQHDWPYDEDLETALAGNKAWSGRVQRIRAKARAQGLKIVISPRASYRGAIMLANGCTEEQAIEACIKAKISAQDWSRIDA